MTIFDQIIQAQELLGRSREHTSSSEEKESFRLAVDALWFIWSNGQADELERYRAEVAAGAPERVIASFMTRAEAMAWLNALPHPPNLALVLIADEYHAILSSHEGHRRSLVADDALEQHLDDMLRKGLPPPAARFDTREEADAWFNQQADPPVQSVIQIGAEPHLAVCFRNIHRRVLFPFTRVEPWRARRDQRQRDTME